MEHGEGRPQGSTVPVEVNGILVHERPVDPDDVPVFSLDHDKAKTVALAREVVLRGGWPTSLTAEQGARLFARSEPATKANPATRRARAAVIGERFFAPSAAEVAREAAALPPADRPACPRTRPRR